MHEGQVSNMTSRKRASGSCTIMLVLTVQLDAGHRVRFRVSTHNFGKESWRFFELNS